MEMVEGCFGRRGGVGWGGGEGGGGDEERKEDDFEETQHAHTQIHTVDALPNYIHLAGQVKCDRVGEIMQASPLPQGFGAK